jgi:integrase
VADKQAKILSLGDVNDLLVFADCTRHPLRNRVIVLLAAKAGLRAVEIAQLTWDMVLDPTGDVGSVIELRDIAAKNGQRPVDPGTPRPSARTRRLSRSLDPQRTAHPIPARRADYTTEYRGLVQSRIPEHRSARLLVALGTQSR